MQGRLRTPNLLQRIWGKESHNMQVPQNESADGTVLSFEAAKYGSSAVAFIGALYGSCLQHDRAP
jgi:hypothetical protein